MPNKPIAVTVEMAEERLLEIELRIDAECSDAERGSRGVGNTLCIATRTSPELAALYAEARNWWRIIAGLKAEGSSS